MVVNKSKSNKNKNNISSNKSKDGTDNKKLNKDDENKEVDISTDVPLNEETSQKKNVGGKFIRTSGYRHKKRRNKHLFISEDDTPSQIKYNYKYERVNSEKKREQKMEDIMKKNQSANVEKNQSKLKKNNNNNNNNKNHKNNKNNSNNEYKNNNDDFNYYRSHLYTFYKEMSEEEASLQEKEITDKNVHINNKYPLNHLYDAFIYLGHSKIIRRAKAWYDNNPIFLVEYNDKAKNENNQISIRKLSLSVTSVYALNRSPQEWHLIDYSKRNPNSGIIKASANLSKKLIDQAEAESKKKNKRRTSSSGLIENAFENCPISLIGYPQYDPFEAEDGVMEDYEPFYDHQLKLNNFVNNLSGQDLTSTDSIMKKKLNANAKSFVPSSMQKNQISSSYNNISTENISHSNEILSGSKVWNNYVKSRQTMKVKNNEIRLNTISQLKEATQRRKRMVQRPSPPLSKKHTVTFKLDSSTTYKKPYYNKKKFNKNSTYARYVANYSIYNDFNKLMQPNQGPYPINYNNVIERINNYYANGANTSNQPPQQPNNKSFNKNQSNKSFKQNNNNNNNNNNNKQLKGNGKPTFNNKNNKNQKQQQQQQQQSNKSKQISINTSNTNKSKTQGPLSRSNNYSPQSAYSAVSSSSSKSPVTQNIHNKVATILMSGSSSPQQFYFSNSYVYGSNQTSPVSSIQNKPRSFIQNLKQKNSNNNSNETTSKNKEVTKKTIGISMS
jgi:hypothetical protein